jgi:hypothetical protein
VQFSLLARSLRRALALSQPETPAGPGESLMNAPASGLPFILGIGQIFRSLIGWPMTILLLFGIATIVLVHLLLGLPLSRAYPFLALVFASVHLLSWIVFRGAFDRHYGRGLAPTVAWLDLIAAPR